MAVHKFRTLIATLLQDRSVQGRWSAIVLIKATIEVGGWETLHKSSPWIRGLLGFLNKPDPPSSKKLCIITLTRIFVLTRAYPTLVREMTTPSLPTFVQAALHMATSTTSSSLLQTILESFNKLLPRHPTIFRSYLKQLQPLLAHLVAPTPSNKINIGQGYGLRAGVTSEIVSAARKIYVQIPLCAPKSGSSEEWAKSVKSAVIHIHRTADKVFRAVLEDWQSTAREPPATNGSTLDDEVQDLEPDNIGLPSWSGIFAGSERLIGLLRILKQYLVTSTASSVHLNVGVIMDLIARMLSLTVPTSRATSFQNMARPNNQISKEERENLWLLLPDVHVASIELLLALTSRSQASTLALDSSIIDQIVWVFGSEKDQRQIRTVCYSAITVLLKRSGATLPKTTTDSLVPLIRCCCDDLLPPEPVDEPEKQIPGQSKANGNSQSKTTSNADTFLSCSKPTTNFSAGFPDLKNAASTLLPVLFANIRAQFITNSLRTRLDRTAILFQHKDAMIASVLNPPPSKKLGKPAASILPLVARLFPHDPHVEGMLRPRMPVIRLGRPDGEIEDDFHMENEDEEIHDEDEDSENLELSDTTESAKELSETPTLPKIISVGLESAAIVSSNRGDFPTYKSTVIVPEPVQFSDTSKRYLGDGADLSPAKRVKNTETKTATTESIHTVQTSQSVTDSFVPAVSEYTAISTVSAISEPLETSGTTVGDADSDDNDVVSLVFGQDTDDDDDED